MFSRDHNQAAFGEQARRQHGFNTRVHKTKLAHPHDWRKLKIHTARFKKGIDMGEVERRLPRSGPLRERFRELVDLVYYHGCKGSDGQFRELPGARNVPTNKAYMSQEDLDKLCQDGNFQRVSPQEALENKTKGWVNVFTVLEEEKERRRVICHPEAGNENVRKSGYKCQIDCGHISEYREHVRQHDRWGFVVDGKCAFWQIKLPKASRAYHRFIGPDGNLYESCVATMGSSPICELMQLIFLVVCGVKDYAHNFDDLVYNVRCSAWVDGLFVTAANKRDATAALAKIEASCKKCNLVLKHKYEHAT